MTLPDERRRAAESAHENPNFVLSHIEGQLVGEARVIAMLRSNLANSKCCENTLGTGNFVSHEDWAEWISNKLKEVGD